MDSMMKDKSEEIFERIRVNDEKFKKVRQLYAPKKSMQECLTYLKSKNVEVKESNGQIFGLKGLPSKVNRFRP